MSPLHVSFFRLSVLCALCGSLPLSAAEIVPLWPGVPPSEPAAYTAGPDKSRPPAEGDETLLITEVTTPVLEVYPAPEKNRTASAVIVCPGGGLHVLAYDKEGTEIAAWLNSLGVTAFVLKYRVPAREHLGPDRRWLAGLQDAQRALSLVRENAAAHRIDPGRSGIMGFSAGGELSARAATFHADRQYEAIDAIDRASCRPDFALLIYPGGLLDKETDALLPDIVVNGDTPPMFFAHAQDDHVSPRNSIALYDALTKAGVPASLHIYDAGGHGFGLRRAPGDPPVMRWPQRAAEWMRSRRLLAPAPAPFVAAFADNLLTVRKDAHPLPLLRAAHSGATLADAYAIQDRWTAAVLDGESPAGFKAGVVSEQAQEKLGVTEPLAGLLFAPGKLSATNKPVIDLKTAPNTLIETEIGFIVSAPITRPVASAYALKKLFRTVVPVIELPGAAFQDGDPPTAADLAAANITAASFILGDEVDLTPELRLDDLAVVLTRDGEKLHAARGAEAWKGQWETLHWIVNHFLARGHTLDPGQVIITGALGGIHPAERGRYKATYGALGAIEFTVE